MAAAGSKRGRGWVCGVAALALLPLTALAAKDQVPDWVRQAAAQTLPEYPARTDAVVLLDEHTYTIAPDGGKTEHVRRVVKVLRQQGREYGQLVAEFSDSEKLKSMHLWSIGADGHEYAVRDNETTDHGVGEGFELYNDNRVRSAPIPAMGVGAVTAMEYERQGRPYENDVIWIPDESIPVATERLQVNLPPGYTYKAQWKDKRTDAAPVDLESGRTLWEVKNLPAHKLEDVEMAPGWLSLASRLDVFYYGPTQVVPKTAMRGDWKDIGLWYEWLAQGRNVPDAAITAKAQELVQGKTEFRARVEAIATFVQQQVRYVAIEIGVGGHQPHPAADIFRTRSGDCKDKATLMSAMLQAVGVHSTWVMVSTYRGVIDGGAPSVIGNHMIGAIQLPADYKPEAMYSVVTTAHGSKRWLLFDPTWEKTPFGQIERELQGGDALLVDGADSTAIRIPVLKPEQNHIERQEMFALTADGNLTGTVHETRGGDIARERRYLFSEKNAKQQQQFFDRLMAGDLLNFQLANLKTANVGDLDKDMSIDYTLKAEHVAQEAGPLLMVRPRVVGSEGFAVDRAERGKKRTVGIDLGATREIHDVCDIKLPAGFTADELPPPVAVDMGFAAYRSKVTADAGVMRYERTFTVREVTLPAERYKDVEMLSKVIASDEGSSAVLKRVQ